MQQALDQQHATGESFGVQINSATLNQLAQLPAAGHVRSVVAKVYPLAQAADAHYDLESRGTQGKLVLAVQPAS